MRNPTKGGMKMTEHETHTIEWKKFQMEYIKLEPGIAKTLRLTNWRQGSWFNKPGLQFDVIEEDSKPVSKAFSTTSKRLIKALQPIIVRAEEQDRNKISITIRRTGEGMDTSYEVAENEGENLPAQVD